MANYRWKYQVPDLSGYSLGAVPVGVEAVGLDARTLAFDRGPGARPDWMDPRLVYQGLRGVEEEAQRGKTLTVAVLSLAAGVWLGFWLFGK